MSLIRELVKKRILDDKRASLLEYEVKNAGQKEEEVLLEKGIVSEDFLFGLKSEIYKIPFKSVSSDDVPLKILETIPEESAKYYKMIPIAQQAKGFEIGMVYPEDLKAREALEFLARQNKFTYQVFLISLSNFNELLKKYKTLKKEVTKALEELETEMDDDKVDVGPVAKSELERMVEEAPISKMVAVILRHAVDGSASDIHIEPTKDQTRVRFRLDGILHSSIFLPNKVHNAVVARIKILSNLKIDETRVPQDGRFSTTIAGRNVDFRVSTFPTTLGEKVVIRILDSGKRKVDFEDLGITGRNLEAIKRASEKPYGMILSTGPTGSGKTTTLYSILSLFNGEEVNIMTLEDPVEYFMEGVNQSQVRPEINYTFSNGLRSMLRQDPDVIMVGEIRDEETASLAIHAALTGHTLLSTLHTSNAAGAIPRLVDMGAEPFLLPPSLSIVIGQRLLRRLCPVCKKKVKANLQIKKKIMDEAEKFPAAAKKSLKISEPLYVYEAVGCKKCNDAGYAGRVGIFEILEMNKELAGVVISDPSEIKIQQVASNQGMITMKQDGILKVLDGITSLEELLRVSEE